MVRYLFYSNQATRPKLLSSYEPQAERLKPPPSAIDFNHRVIKLSGHHSSTTSLPPVAQKACMASSGKSDSSFDFVINSRPRSTSSSSADSTARGSVSDSLCGGSLQKTDCKTTPMVNTKVKLHRAVKLPPTEVTPMDIEENIGLTCNNNTMEDDVAMHDGNGSKVKPHQRSAVSFVYKKLEAVLSTTNQMLVAKTLSHLVYNKVESRYSA